MYNAIDVARHVINYSNEKDYLLSYNKLPKVLYYIQALFLIKRDAPCFIEEIRACEIGPEIDAISKEFDTITSLEIPPITHFLEGVGGQAIREEYLDDILSDNDKALIDSVVDLLSIFTSTELLNILHNQKPFKEAFDDPYDNIIKPESIKAFYS